jgi:hypothetical protein
LKDFFTMYDPDSHYRVVVQGSDGAIKGYAEKSQWATANGSLSADRESIRLTRLDSGSTEEVPLEKVKAVFFVRDFAGEVQRRDLRFHDHLPATECLWVRVRFDDGETIEGLINNTQDFVLGTGFLMAPADTLGNNWLIYVPKSKLMGFEVLGLRAKTKSLSLLDEHA